MDKKESIKLYIKLLDNICEADYIDRITFQKQIWQFNEMSFLIKIFYNNLLFKEMLPKCPDLRYIRFTKVLTKYSNEYNNQIFLQNLSHILFLDKKDVFSLFIKLQKKYSEEQIYTICKAYDISKLDVNRIYRYIDKFDNKLKTNSQPSQSSQPSHTNAEYIQDTKYIKYTQVNEVNEEFQENEDLEYNDDAEDN
jgi:hypothetical protein